MWSSAFQNKWHEYLTVQSYPSTTTTHPHLNAVVLKWPPLQQLFAYPGGLHSVWGSTQPCASEIAGRGLQGPRDWSRKGIRIPLLLQRCLPSSWTWSVHPLWGIKQGSPYCHLVQFSPHPVPPTLPPSLASFAYSGACEKALAILLALQQHMGSCAARAPSMAGISSTAAWPQ